MDKFDRYMEIADKHVDLDGKQFADPFGELIGTFAFTRLRERLVELKVCVEQADFICACVSMLVSFLCFSGTCVCVCVLLCMCPFRFWFSVTSHVFRHDVCVYVSVATHVPVSFLLCRGLLERWICAGR